jgi:tetratricopeptide (TPR) repeat protein
VACLLAGGLWLAAIGVPVVMHAAPAHAQATTASTANQQFLLAYRLFNRGEDALAQEAFIEFTGGFASDPKVGDARYYLALLERRKGNSKKAQEYLADAPAPSLVPTYAMQVLHGQVLTELGQYKEAIAVLEQVDVTNLAPLAHASVLFLKGTAYRESGNLTAAQQAMKDAAAQDSALKARATMEQGRLLAMQGKPEEAIEMLKACLALDDSTVTPDAARLAGDLSYELQKFPDAVGYYDTVIRRHQSSPQFAPAAVGMLWALLGSGQYDAVQRANSQLRPTLKGVDAFMADYIAGGAYQAAGEHAQAVQKFTALLNSPVSADQPRDKAVYKLAMSQFELKRYDDLAATLKDFDSRFADSPLRGDVEFLLAASEVKQGNTAAAAARLTAIVNQGTSGPYYLDSIMQRARLYESTDDYPAAIEDYRLYLKMAAELQRPLGKGDAAKAALRQIDLLNRTGKNDESLAAVEILLSRPGIEPLDKQEAMYRKSRALIDKKEYDKAIAALVELDREFPQNRFAAESWYYRGMLLMTLNRPDEAVDPLIAAGRSDQLSLAMRINAYRLAASQMHEKRPGFAVDLLYELEKVATRDVLQPQELIWISRYLTQTGEARKSLSYLSALLAEDSQAPGVARAEAVLLAGLNMQSLDRREEAIVFFMQVRALSQGFEQDAQLQLARTLWRKGELAKAIEEYRGLISVERADIAAPAIFDSAQIYRELARQYESVSQDRAAAEQADREAIKLYKRLTVLWGKPSLSPLPELSYLNHAELEVRLSIGNGEATYKELTERFKDTPHAAYAQAMIEHINRKDGDALAILTKLRDKDLEPALAIRVRDSIKELEGAQ